MTQSDPEQKLGAIAEAYQQASQERALAEARLLQAQMRATILMKQYRKLYREYNRAEGGAE